MISASLNTAILDIAAALNRIPLVGMLGWQDLRQRYRRSALGPFWLTLSMGIMIATIGVVFSQIFKSPLVEFLPFLASGMIIWGFISAVLIESCNSFISAEGIIKQLSIPLFVHVLRTIWRNFLIFSHNILILPLVYLVVGKQLSWICILSILGMMLMIVNLIWVALILGIVCCRYRDLPQMVFSVTQIIFYLTPIMWMPKYLPNTAGIYLLDLNPVYHLLEITRAPLLGEVPSGMNWGISAGVAIAGWMIALLLYGRYKRRIAFWL